ncbi:hypothetical protein L873DRAFT_102187 [Choiromyces venosus 120613-1]|uniref:Uncharacterized protein n=1 Tax=Choiromyces venosus 120613-1 TaxID=1336337 RepID=A0A3N4JZX0_9PEZI|nr:hypothetical protein L873DRAFT_102187 [Choiromyces venosus 120613-1]
MLYRTPLAMVLATVGVNQQGVPRKQDAQLPTARSETQAPTHPQVPHTPHTHPATHHPNSHPCNPTHTHSTQSNPSTQARAHSLPPIQSPPSLTHPHNHHNFPLHTPFLSLSMQMIKAPSPRPPDVSFIPVHHHPPPTTSSISSKRALHSHFLISPLPSSSPLHL